MNKIDGSHHDVRLSPQEQRVIRLWIDTGAQYPGTYAALGTGQVGGCWNNNEPIRVMADDWPSTPAAREAVERRCAPCHGHHLPRHVTDQVPSLSFQDMLAWERPLSRLSRHRIFNLGQPEQSLVLLTPLAREAGGYAEGHADPRPVVENRQEPPQPIVHPILFADTGDRDYQAILSHLEAARDKLAQIKRFDMPGFRPNEHYIREMQRYGVLPASLDANADPLDVYAIDEAYWRLFWHCPDPSSRTARGSD